MVNEFRAHIKKQFPSLQGTTFLLACSGGVDSTVLAYLCKRSKMDFAIAHCNFNLRGTESDADEKFVKDLADKLEKKIHVTHFETNDYASKNKVSIQMAARALRYAWFTETMATFGYTTLVTAHQLNDSLETFLINLSRGTGIDGLTGIPEKTNTIARPLLMFSRERILQYAKNEGIEWRDDSSNAETTYLRNRIRHKLIPGLLDLHPTFLENFQTTQAHLQHTSLIVDDHVKDIREKLFQNKGDVIHIAISPLLELYPLQTYLYSLFKAYGFTEWQDVADLLCANSGKQVVSKTHRLVKDRTHLLLTTLKNKVVTSYQIEKNQTVIREPIHMSITETPYMEKTSGEILYVDKETLKYPLTVRKWKKGDYFYPFGMRGTKKVSKFFKDEKIDVISKEKQWLLCSGEDVVWIIGKRGDNRFKVTGKTKGILKFSIQE
ncbi:MAG: tRNA lysidine(34) synthetase TilS [Bacteroidota bacterium]